MIEVPPILKEPKASETGIVNQNLNAPQQNHLQVQQATNGAENQSASFSFTKNATAGAEVEIVSPKVQTKNIEPETFKKKITYKEQEPQTPSEDRLISSRSGQSKGRIYDSAIDFELEEAQQRKLQEKSVKFLIETILMSGDGVTPINDLMNTRDSKNESRYARVLTTFIVVIHTYNFFTCFFFLGIVGYPRGFWFIFECIAELVMFFDFVLQIILRSKCGFVWTKMYLLHNSITPTKTRDFKRLLVSLPTTIIVSTALVANPDLQNNIGFACLRLLKLLRWGEVSRFFDLFDLKQRQISSFGLFRALFIIFYFNVFMHFWTCIWLLTGRVDFSRDVAGWYKMANFNLNPTWLEMYIESYYFVLTTFAGAGFGNVVPSTNLEWAIDTVINLVGSSLFICIFVDFVTEFSMRDLRLYKNNEKLNSTLMFAESSSLPPEQVFKIRYYYQDLFLKFEDFQMKFGIVRELPKSIQGQVSLMLNAEIIQYVKFFQMAPPLFITEMSKMMRPSIAMNDDYIVRINEDADKMYFLHSGYVEVLCKNNRTPLMYLGKGAYFGEIGCLLTGKRSVSVRAKSNSVIYFVLSHEIVKLLKKFPEQQNFLKGVAMQRYETTPYDTLKTRQDNSDIASGSSRSQFPQRYAEMKKLFDANISISMQKKPWLNQKIEAIKRYILIPFTPMWWIWNTILVFAIATNIILIPYGIGFEGDYATHPLIIFGVIVYMCDIFVRMRTAITNDNKICTDVNAIFEDYLNKWLLLDVIATFPFEYIFIATKDSGLRLVMLLKLLKIGRLIETVNIFMRNTRSSISMSCFFLSLFVLYGILMHFQACFLGYIGRWENTRNSRYDGKSYFKDFETRAYITLGPMVDLPYFDQYLTCLYLSGQVMQAVSYGDAVVYAMSEQIIVLLFFVFTHTLRAFLMVKLADYLGKIQKAQIQKIQKNDTIDEWMKSQNLSKEYFKKIKALTHERRHSKDLFEGSEILLDLPQSLRTDIKIYLEEKSAKKQSMSKLMEALLRKATQQIQDEKQKLERSPDSKHEKSNVIQNTDQEDPLKNQEDEVNMAKKIAEAQYKPQLTEEYLRFMKYKRIFEWVILLITTWNMWFIPLQFAYNIPFNGIFLAFEILTILLYLAEIIFRFHIISWMRNVECVIEENLSRKHQKVAKSEIEFMKETNAQYYQIVINCVSVVPLSLLLQQIEQVNLWLCIVLSSLRMIKTRPNMKWFKQNQKEKIAKWRIISTLYLYYVFCHWTACIMIKMAVHSDDWTQNWLRRCPVPQMTGTRTLPDERKDLSMLSVYVHALYYTVGTVSHVAIGDITAVNPYEYLCNVIFGWVGTFVYCLLFADITLLVLAASNPRKKEFHMKRSNIMTKLKNPNIPQFLVDQASFYLDYNYQCFQGISLDEMLDQLPQQLKADFLLEKYMKTVEACLFLRTTISCDIKQDLASQFLKMLSTQIFLNGQFVVKVGQLHTETVFILEGQLNLMWINYKENSGNLLPGDFYGTDLEPNIRENYNNWFFKKYVGYDSPNLTIDSNDNFEGRSVLHLVAKKIVTVGFLTKSQLNYFYKSYPQFKQIIQKSNRFLFENGRKQIENLIRRQNNIITRDACVELLTTQFEQTSDVQYKKIQVSQYTSMALYKLDEADLSNISRNCKLYFIENLEKQIRQHFKFRVMTQTTKKKKKNAEPTGLHILCCEEYAVEETGLLKKYLTYAKFFNLIYISIATPFFIAFTTKRMGGAVLILEVISHSISLICFLAMFRTPVVKESGESTLDLKYIIKTYMKNGMILDIISFLPINIVLPFYFYLETGQNNNQWIIFISLTPLRALRILSVQLCPALFYTIKTELIQYQTLLTNISNVFFIILFGHWCVCCWVFTTSVLEKQLVNDWFRFFSLGEKQLWEIYIRNWYAVANIVSSVGSGDIYGVTDIERLFFTFLMTAADVIFALAFGLLAELTSNSRQGNESQMFLDKMMITERIMQQADFNSNWKDRVQQYLTYKNKLETSTKNLNADDLKASLPLGLVKEILYYSNKSILQALFINIDSGNFMRDLAFTLRLQIFMPEDSIIARGTKIEAIYFIVEGQAKKLNKKLKVMEKIRTGTFCGQEALFQEITPKYSVKAETFVLMKILNKSDIKRNMSNYPQMSKEIALQQNAKHKRTKNLKRVFDEAFTSNKNQANRMDTEQGLITVDEETESINSRRKKLNSSSESLKQSSTSSLSEDSGTEDVKELNSNLIKNEIRNTRRKTEHQQNLLSSRRRLMQANSGEFDYSQLRMQKLNNMTPKLSARGALIGTPTLSSRIQISNQNKDSQRDSRPPAFLQQSIDTFAQKSQTDSNLNLPMVQFSGKKQSEADKHGKSKFFQQNIKSSVAESSIPESIEIQSQPQSEIGEILVYPEFKVVSEQVVKEHNSEVNSIQDSQRKDSARPITQTVQDTQRSQVKESHRSTQRSHKQRRLSQMSVGSKLSIQQDESINIVIEVIPKEQE